jgi:hypothetical protein
MHDAGSSAKKGFARKERVGYRHRSKGINSNNNPAPQAIPELPSIPPPPPVPAPVVSAPSAYDHETDNDDAWRYGQETDNDDAFSTQGR